MAKTGEMMKRELVILCSQFMLHNSQLLFRHS
jgi:hypothetical protein